MKTLILGLVMTVFISHYNFGQRPNQKHTNKDSQKIDSVTLKVEKLNIELKNLAASIDKKEINKINHSGELTLNSPDRKITLNDYAPWIATLIIGLLSYVVGRGQISKMNEQISLGKRTIESQKEIAITEIKKNIILGNRQRWISELRELISEIIGLMQLMDLTIQFRDKTNLWDNENISRVNKLLKLECQIQLMLNLKEKNHRDLLAELKNYDFDFEEKLTEDKKEEKKEKNEKIIKRVIELSQTILKEEWERIKRLD